MRAQQMIFPVLGLFLMASAWLTETERTAGLEGLECPTGEDGVPVTYDLETPVEVWWASHPYNPESPCYLPIGSIRSPEPVLNVRDAFGGNIQAAIDALPASGGTLYFPAGTYGGDWTLVGKNNVHFVSNGGATLTGTGRVAASRRALSYQEIVECVHRHDPECLEIITTGRVHNIYFKNLTFDGQGTQLAAVSLRAVKQVLFENVTFQNYRDPRADHRGLVWGSAWLDDVWIRGSRFLGSERWAVYLDGLHAGGVVESEIEHHFGAGGLLFLTNQDANFDLNGDGTFTLDELRQANHVVVAYNTFGKRSGDRPLITGIQLTGRDSIVERNTILAPVLTFLSLSGKCDAVNHGDNIKMVYENLHVRANEARRVGRLVLVSGEDDSCGILGNEMEIGRYSVVGNRVERFLEPDPALVVEESPPILGPNTISGNVCEGKPCDDLRVQRE